LGAIKNYAPNGEAPVQGITKGRLLLIAAITQSFGYCSTDAREMVRNASSLQSVCGGKKIKLCAGKG
jgi:hypothetical protein